MVRQCRIILSVHAVIETNAYLAAAKEAGMSEEEMIAVVDRISADPMIGDIMPGCGGARKLRVARPGRGKSGGYRVITYVAGLDIPVFLLTVSARTSGPISPRASVTRFRD